MPVLQLAEPEQPRVSLRAMELAERDNTPSVDDDDFIADQPPEIPTAGDRNSASLAALSFTDTDPVEGAWRTVQRPAGRRPGGDEPGVLGLLPQRRLRRGLSELRAASRLPVHLRLR